jgi:hypothetical protein
MKVIVTQISDSREIPTKPGWYILSLYGDQIELAEVLEDSTNELYFFNKYYGSQGVNHPYVRWFGEIKITEIENEEDT